MIFDIYNLKKIRYELALALVTLGMRLYIFSYAGSPLPYYDQWAVEYNNTFLQILGSHSIWSILFTPGNEHVLLTTKLVSLAGFTLNGYWSISFLVFLAAIFRTIEAVWLFRLLGTNANAVSKNIAWFICLAVFATPISGFNLLCGLEISFYLADIAFIGALFCVQYWSTPWKSGLLLVIFTVLGLLSMGSALAIPGATLVAHLLSRQNRRGFFVAWSLTALVALKYIMTVPNLIPLDTVPVGRRIRFFLELISWPGQNMVLGVFSLLAVIIAVIWLRRKSQLWKEPFPLIGGIFVFGATNAAFIALNRLPHMRHWDVIALVPLSLVMLWTGILSARPRSPAATRLAGVVLAVYGLALIPVWRESWDYIKSAHAHRDEALAYYRTVLISNGMDRESAKIKQLLTERNYSFFDDPVLRFSPTPETCHFLKTAPVPTFALLSPEILPVRPFSLFDIVVDKIFSAGWLIGAVGILVGGFNLYMTWKDETASHEASGNPRRS